MEMSTPDVLVLGPATWNTMLVVDELPQPRTQMMVAHDSWETVGGTSAGKALHLADAGVPARLLTPIADDAAGARVREALRTLDVEPLPTERTERHVNLMTQRGERISIYATPPATTAPPSLETLTTARVLVLDLAPWTRELAERLAGATVTVWSDLHDIGPDTSWHDPFLRAATVVQCSAENLERPVDFLRGCVERGAELAVCTLGSHGAVSVDADGVHEVRAVPCTVLDTNGAGDAFFAGMLAARLAGADTPGALIAGSQQAVRAVTTRDLGPGVARGDAPDAGAAR